MKELKKSSQIDNFKFFTNIFFYIKTLCILNTTHNNDIQNFALSKDRLPVECELVTTTLSGTKAEHGTFQICFNTRAPSFNAGCLTTTFSVRDV